MNYHNPKTEPDAMLGPYRVIGEIGAGGMGQVLKAEDTVTGAVRAIKVRYMFRERRTPSHLNLRRELRAMARCEHPNVVRAYEVGEEPEFIYLVMEYVDGVPLDDYLDAEALEPGPRRDRLAAFLGMQLASALDHIHNRGLIHRDLKPDNILVTADEVVKLIDFGIAQEFVAGQTVKPGDIAGTYAYCSPEQVSEVPLDHRSDLYALGVVLYQMLTDHLPFVAESQFAFVVSHITKQPTPIETYYPGASSTFRDLILSLLAKKPIDRPQRSREVELFLRDFIEQFDQDRRGPRLALYATGPDLASPAARLNEPAFVGRKAELVQIEGAFSLLEAGVGGVMVVLGEVGIGKSRLLDEALADPRARGMEVHVARCLPHAERRFQAALDLVDGMVSGLEGRTHNLIRTMLGQHLSVLGQVVPGLSQRLPPWEESTQATGAPAELDRVREALRAFLESVPSKPTVLVIKDGQWADAATLSLVHSLASSTGEPLTSPVLWLMSVSTDELADDHPFTAWVSEPPRLAQNLWMSPVTEGEVTEMVQSMLGRGAELGALESALSVESRGNPLYVTEAVRELVERGNLCYLLGEEDEEGLWAWLSVDDEPPVVSTLGEMLAGRLSRLSEAATEVVEWMATLGRPCSYEWLQAVTGHGDEALLDIIDDLVERRTVTERIGKRRTIFSFYHPQMFRVVLEGIEPARLKRLYRKAADAWLEVHGDADAASIDLVSTLLFQGNEYHRAASYLLKAARDRIALGLYQAAQHFLEQALGCCVREPSLRGELEIQLELELGVVMEALDHVVVALAYLQEAFGKAQQAGLEGLAGEALSSMGTAHARYGNYTWAVFRFSAALDLLEAGGNFEGALRCLDGTMMALLRTGDLDSARDAVSRFEEFTLAHGMEGQAKVQQRRADGVLAALEGRLERARQLLEQASEEARTRGLTSLYLRCQLDEAEVRSHLGDLGGARAQVSRGIDGLERLASPGALARGLAIQAAVLCSLRDLDGAVARLERAQSLIELTPHEYVQASIVLTRARLLLVQGRMQLALALEPTVMAACEGNRYLALAIRARTLFGAVRLRAGDTENAAVMLERTVREAEKLGFRPGATEARAVYAEALVVLGRRVEAEAALDLAVEDARRMGQRVLLLRVMVLRGRLAMDDAQSWLANEYFRGACQSLREIGLGLNRTDVQLLQERPEVKLLQYAMERMRGGV